MTITNGAVASCSGALASTKFRASSYNIYVDLPGGESAAALIVHGYTGAYDKVSRDLAHWLQSRGQGNTQRPLFGTWVDDQPNIAENWNPDDSTINVLKERGYLTSLSHEDEVAAFSQFARTIHEQELKSMPSYVIMPTYNCNLRCNYCFQDHMRTDAANAHLLGTMSIATADKIMDSFSTIETDILKLSGSEIERNFTLFGGEPLLAKSRTVVEHFLRRQRSEGNYSFMAVTNGTELEAYADLLGPGGISTLQITIDGPPDVHNRRRIYADSSGSFEDISKNIDLALRNGAKIVVRVNVDRANFESIVRLAEYYVASGWAETPGFSSYLAPIHDYAGSGKAGGRPDFFNHFELREMQKNIQNEFEVVKCFTEVDGGLKNRIKGIFSGQPIAPKASFCGAHASMFIFDAFGDIYSCWDRTGSQSLKIGYVGEEGKVTLNGLASVWRARDVVSNPICRQCRFALNCGGGCAVLAEVSSGTINANFCDAYGKRFRYAVAEAYQEFTKTGEVALSDAARVSDFLR